MFVFVNWSEGHLVCQNAEYFYLQIAFCTFQVNTLNREVMSEFRDIFSKIQNDTKVRAVVISSSKPDCFVAGADVTYVFFTAVLLVKLLVKN